MRDDAAGAIQSTPSAEFKDEGVSLLDLAVPLAENLKLLVMAPILVGAAATGIKRPVALPFAPDHRRFRHQPKDFPVTHHHRMRILSLPMFAEITVAQMSAVADANQLL